MKSSIPDKKNAPFVEFSQQLSKNVEDFTLSVDQMEQAYEYLSNIMLSFPTGQDTDSVVRQRLMENILRRDMYVFLEALHGMKKTLVKAVRVFIASGDAALAAYDGVGASDDQRDASISHAEAELVKSLRLLRRLDQRLSSHDSKY